MLTFKVLELDDVAVSILFRDEWRMIGRINFLEVLNTCEELYLTILILVLAIRMNYNEQHQKRTYSAIASPWNNLRV